LPLVPYPFLYLRRIVLALAAFLAAHTVLLAQADERIIYASVVDKDGAPVMDLGAQDFVVREDGMAREVLRVTRDTDPLQIALLVDNSAAMRSRVAQLRRAAAAFVGSTREGVPIALITLAERPTIAASYNPDRATLLKAVDKLFAFEAGSYLLDGIAETSQGLPQRQLRRSAIVVLTGLGPELSYRQYTEVLRIFREGGASLHVLQFGTGIGRREREIVVNTGTSETGGRFEEILTTAGFEAKAAQLGAELSNQYRVVYARPSRMIPPRQIQVSVKRTDLRARGMAARHPRD
jgi:VWFA-related protein